MPKVTEIPILWRTEPDENTLAEMKDDGTFTLYKVLPIHDVEVIVTWAERWLDELNERFEEA
jgi:hypothetical protein